jgi:hypothetical protein
MDGILKDLYSRGGKLLADTKTIKRAEVKTQPVSKKVLESVLEAPVEQDPHKAFRKSVIQNKPAKKKIVEDFKRFIAIEEAKL